MLISVIIPLYNKEKSIASTLKSVLMQDFDDYEIVIVNDGSTDDSVEIVKSFDDSRIRLINQDNSGVSSARNRGIRESKGKYIALLDGDDEWAPDYLSTQVSLINKYQDCQIFITGYTLRIAGGESRNAIIKGIDFKEEDGILTDYFDVASRSEPPCCSINIVAEKSCYDVIGGFPLNVTNGEDLLTWARLAINYKIAYSRKIKAIYNLKENFGVNSKPINIPQGNVVGEELEMLLSSQSAPKSLRKYIGRWYKIRSHLFLRGGERKNAIINIFRTIKYNPEEWKIYIYLIMLILPNRLVNKLFKII